MEAKSSDQVQPLIELLTLAETARTLRVSEGTIYKKMRDGDLAVIRIGGRTLVERSEIERIVAAGRQAAEVGGGP